MAPDTWEHRHTTLTDVSRCGATDSRLLEGIATGDAIGKQTEGLSAEDVQPWYPNGIRGFEGSAGSPIPRCLRNRKRKWRIGETTDDTERTIAVARAILEDGDVHHVSVGRELLKCEKCVHPGVKSLWEFHQAGDPARVAQGHDGCGAAIRVAPVGIRYPSNRLEDIVRGAREASIPTHGGVMAIAAAAATAAAVSAAIDGASAAEMFELGYRAATLSEVQCAGSANGTFATALRTIRNDLHGWSELQPTQVAARYFPQTPLTIVPLALALGTLIQSAETAILVAANVGGDSDSVASIVGAVLGARFPESVNDEWHVIVEQVNGHDLLSLARDLSSLRC